MDTFGRKKALCFTYIPIMLSWLIFVYADSYCTILIGRVLQGFIISKLLTYLFKEKKIIANHYLYIDTNT